MDAATSWNPATDLNATDGGAFYEQFVDKRNELTTNFDTAVGNAINDSKGLDEQGYTKLDADMDASTAIGKTYQDAYDDVTDGDSSTGAYTDSSADAFIKAFDAAKQHYTDLSRWQRQTVPIRITRMRITRQRRPLSCMTIWCWLMPS